MAQTVKRLSTMWETWVWSLGWEDSLEKEIATHSSTLALKIPRTEELGAGYYPWGRKESGMTEWLHFHFHLNGLVVFPTFFNLSLKLAIRSAWSEQQSAPSLVFTDCIVTSPSLASKDIINLISALTIWWCPHEESSLVLLEEGVFYDQCVLLAKLY